MLQQQLGEQHWESACTRERDKTQTTKTKNKRENKEKTPGVQEAQHRRRQKQSAGNPRNDVDPEKWREAQCVKTNANGDENKLKSNNGRRECKREANSVGVCMLRSLSLSLSPFTQPFFVLRIDVLKRSAYKNTQTGRKPEEQQQSASAVRRRPDRKRQAYRARANCGYKEREREWA